MPLLTISETAMRLNISDSQARRLVETGRLRAVNLASRPGKTRAIWRIPEEAIQALEEGRERR